MFLPDIVGSSFTPWQQGTGTFNSVMPPNNWKGVPGEIRGIFGILPKDQTQRCSSV